MPRKIFALALLVAAGACLGAGPALAQDDGKLMDRAREQLEAAVRGNPSDFKARTLLGRSFSLLGQYDQALDQFKAAAALGDPSALLLAADALADRGDPAAAFDSYESAKLAAKRAGDAGRQAEAELGIAQVETSRGNHRKALDIVTRLQGGDRQVVNRIRARLLALSGAARTGLVLQEGPVAIWTEGARAREALERALSVDENDATVLYALGRFYLEAPPGFGDNEKAELLLGRAAKVRPGNVLFHAWHLRALQLRGKSGGLEAELTTFEKAFGTLPAGKAMAERLKNGDPPI